MCNGSNFSTSSPTPVSLVVLFVWLVGCFFGSGHPGAYESVSHCGFDLHFPND